MADRIIKRVFHDFESGGLAFAVNSKIIVRFFQHPAVAVNEGDARQLKPRQHVRHGIRRQKVIAVEKLDRRQGGGGNACILRLSGAAVGLLDDFAVGEGSDQVFGDFDGTVRGTIIDNNKLPFEVSFLGENAFQGRLKIPFLVLGGNDEGNALGLAVHSSQSLRPVNPERCHYPTAPLSPQSGYRKTERRWIRCAGIL